MILTGWIWGVKARSGFMEVGAFQVRAGPGLEEADTGVKRGEAVRSGRGLGVRGLSGLFIPALAPSYFSMEMSVHAPFILEPWTLIEPTSAGLHT